jgi:hypothetical protein
VGKGKDKRYLSKKNRNPYWSNIVNKVGYRAEIIEDNLTEEESFIREKYYIQFFGRENLSNMTNGGEGASGYLHTQETKNILSVKISNSMKGKKREPFSNEWRKKIGEKSRLNNLGKKLSQETKDKIKNSLIGTISPKRKEVINIDTNEIYNHPQDVCDKYGYKYSTFSQYLNGRRKNKTPFQYYNPSN